MLFYPKGSILQLYSGENKVHSKRWWWWYPLYSRPTLL